MFNRNNKNKIIILIAAGNNNWNDNAKHIYDYIDRLNTNIKPVAVLKKFHKGERPKRYVVHSSLNNIRMIVRSDVMMSTHSLYDIGPRLIVWMSSAKKIALKHGVTGIKYHEHESYKWLEYDFVCSTSKYESDILTKYRGIDSEKIKITGFARHDYLKKIKKDKKSTKILFMPTFRDTSYDTLLIFNWIGKLEISKEYELLICPHPNWKLNDILNIVPKSVKIIETSNIQKYFNQIAILITDYSSIAFDAAIYKIPVIFYQPDIKVYCKKRGLYDEYDNNNMLNKIYEEEQLVKEIKKILFNSEYNNNRIKIDYRWAKKYITTFDGHSCERIVNNLIY